MGDGTPPPPGTGGPAVVCVRCGRLFYAGAQADEEEDLRRW